LDRTPNPNLGHENGPVAGWVAAHGTCARLDRPGTNLVVVDLDLVELHKQYGGQIVVDHLTLHVNDGEFVTLLGPSGCGKTTTLRAIAGLVEIDGGEIRFAGRRMNDVPPHKRSTAMVFQSYALFPHMTVQQNIGFGLRMRHVSGRERDDRVEEAMAMVGLEGLGERKPSQLSGGQQQRVALARAVVTRPDILLFDEPLSNLDAKLRERLRIEIRELQRRLGITTIYVTHDQAEALVISDRIVVMNKGRIEQIGEPLTIYRQPATSFAAEFIGQANVLEAELVAVTSDGSELDTRIGRLVSSARPDPERRTVLISWRPEDMVPFTADLTNRIDATVVRTIFMGNLTDVTVEVNGTAIRIERPGSVDWQVGDSITLGLAADRIQVLR
jgi:iron(III) transport system ATP-binding protein